MDPGENISETVRREFMEEAMNSLESSKGTICLVSNYKTVVLNPPLYAPLEVKRLYLLCEKKKYKSYIFTNIRMKLY